MLLESQSLPRHFLSNSLVSDPGLAVARTGKGHPLFLLHGIGGSADIFSRQFEALSERFEMVAWDAPGYGHSGDPVGVLDIEAYVTVAAETLASTFPAGSFVVGMSWGGVIATLLSVKHPELVKGLILGASTVGSGSTDESSSAMKSRYSEIVEVGREEFCRRRSKSLLSRNASDIQVEWACDHMLRSIRLPGYFSATQAMASTDTSYILDQIQAKVLVIWGSDDLITGAAASAKLVSGLPCAEVCEVRGAGHLVNFEAPLAFNRKLENFVTSLVPE